MTTLNFNKRQYGLIAELRKSFEKGGKHVTDQEAVEMAVKKFLGMPEVSL